MQDLNQRLRLPPRGGSKQRKLKQSFSWPGVDRTTKSLAYAQVRWIIKGRRGVISQMHHYFLQPMYTLRFYTSFQVSRIFMQIQNLGFPPGLRDTGHCIFMKPFFLSQLSIKIFFNSHSKRINISFYSQKTFFCKTAMCIINCLLGRQREIFSFFNLE